jgi:hypothetical protein
MATLNTIELAFSRVMRWLNSQNNLLFEKLYLKEMTGNVVVLEVDALTYIAASKTEKHVFFGN